MLTLPSLPCRSAGPRWLVWLLVALALVLGPAQARADATVRDIRVSANGQTTRVVLDLSRPVPFRHLVLGGPPRLAIDLPDVAWVVPESVGDHGRGLVERFRFGYPSPGVSRLVLDLAGPFEIKEVFELPAENGRGHRIVTDLVPLADPMLVPAGARHPGLETAALPATDGEQANGAAAAPADGRSAAIPVPARRPAPEVAAGQPRVVVIDPGHGGIDPGAIGRNGTYEKNVVLAHGLEIRRQLERAGYKVVMTREDDTTVRLRERLQIAREARGELFLSLHADSLTKAPQVRGASVYTLSEEASSQEAALLARKENRADILSGVDLSEQEDIVTQILIDLAQRDANNKSIRFAERLVEALADTTKLARRQRHQAGFVVLKSPDMPSALIELGYLSNPDDERQLEDEAHRAKVATAIVEAIERYFDAEAS